MKTLKKRIERLLKEKESCRNNDLTLCSEIWQQECLAMGSNLSDLSAVHFLHFISIGKLSKQQSILRARRSLNNSKPETVGKSYKSNIKNKKKSSLKSKKKSFGVINQRRKINLAKKPTLDPYPYHIRNRWRTLEDQKRLDAIRSGYNCPHGSSKPIRRKNFSRLHFELGLK